MKKTCCTRAYEEADLSHRNPTFPPDSDAVLLRENSRQPPPPVNYHPFRFLSTCEEVHTDVGGDVKQGLTG